MKNPDEKELQPHHTRLEIIGLILFAVIVIYFIGLMDSKAQNLMGCLVYKGFRPLIGDTGLYLLPFALIMLSITCILHRDSRIMNAVAQFFCLVCFIAPPMDRLYSKLFWKDFWHQSDNESSGLIGSTIGGLFENAFGSIGGIVVLLVLAMISIPSVTGYAPIELVRGMINLRNKINPPEGGKETKSDPPKKKRKKPLKENNNETSNKAKPNGSPANDHFTPGSEIPSAQITLIKAEKQQMQINFKPMIREAGEYQFPPTDILQEPVNDFIETDKKMLAEKIEAALKSFDVDAKVTGMIVGSSVIRCELKPAPGVRVKKVLALQDDLKLALSARRLSIQAPIPGKNVIGIEFPKSNRNLVTLREVLESDEFTNSNSLLALCIGKDLDDNTIVEDLNRMPHLLVAGQTGAGKSVCLNAIIISLLYKSAPDEVKMILIDPKRVELTLYDGMPHLLVPVIDDWQKAKNALIWVAREMTQRLDKFKSNKCRSIAAFNRKRPKGEFMPYIIIVIDEYATLMDLAPNGKELMRLINHLARLARATGIHLICATQRPEVKVITGSIKANIPARIAFSVASQVDSRTILDKAGAEKLLGEGDMLYSGPGDMSSKRAQGAFINDEEIEKVVEFLTNQMKPAYINEILEDQGEIDDIDGISPISSPSPNNDDDNDGIVTGFENANDDEEYFQMAVKLVHERGKISASWIQREFRIGYIRASRIIDRMEQLGIITGMDGQRTRRLIEGNDFMDSIENP